eukprot:Protomagalhaensia_sp_Gyna_25__1167@NODE_1574_length_1718_cov_121_266230_g1281_i0_p1_GENE_NODE_1574_length_1718_cov_121_266230_g1281_i0NODE_1574_length_1718_cov_121_266230_g1281_i0_p1_ORF_typecomplete_len493_score65_66_NODE_1574_length_1718_cov_121_266230_g1281_i01701648
MYVCVGHVLYVCIDSVLCVSVCRQPVIWDCNFFTFILTTMRGPLAIVEEAGRSCGDCRVCCALMVFGGPKIVMHMTPQATNEHEVRFTNKYLATLKKQIGRLPSRKLCNWPEIGVRLQGEAFERPMVWNQAHYWYIKYLKTHRYSWKPFLDFYVLDKARDYLHVFQLSKLKQAVYRSLTRQQRERVPDSSDTPCIPMSLSYGRFRLLPQIPQEKRNFFSRLLQITPPAAKQPPSQPPEAVQPKPEPQEQGTPTQALQVPLTLEQQDTDEAKEGGVDGGTNSLMEWISYASDIIWPSYASDLLWSVIQTGTPSGSPENDPQSKEIDLIQSEQQLPDEVLPAWQRILRYLPLGWFLSEPPQVPQIESAPDDDPINEEPVSEEPVNEWDELKWLDLMNSSSKWMNKVCSIGVEALSQVLVWVEQIDFHHLDPLLAATYQLMTDSKTHKKPDENMWRSCWESLNQIAQLNSGIGRSQDGWNVAVIEHPKRSLTMSG